MLADDARAERFSIRESDRWVERSHGSRRQVEWLCFSIRESDRWVES